MRKVTKAVIPAAGLGTRFLPATKAQPKEMLPIVDTPTIQFVMEEAVESGITDILVITGKDKRSIEDHFDRNPELERRLHNKQDHSNLHDVRRLAQMAHIHYVRQGEQLGLGHAIMQARWHVGDEPFVVLLGDTIIDSEVPCTRQLMDAYEKYGGSIVGLEQVEHSKVDRYGIIAGDPCGPRAYELSDLIEKPEPSEAPSDLAIGGRYILTPGIFDYLAKTRAGKGNEIQLTDALRLQTATEAVFGYHFEGTRYDIGNRTDYLITQIEYALKRDDLRTRILPYLKEKAQTL